MKSLNPTPITHQDMMRCQPTAAFVGASWTALGMGVGAFVIGLWNANTLSLSEKGFYLSVLLMGLYAAISLQKTVRDKQEGLPISKVYYNISWGILGISLLMMCIGLYNATLQFNEKGFYSMAFILSLFAVITIQKNIRDVEYVRSFMNNTAAYTPDDADETN